MGVRMKVLGIASFLAAAGLLCAQRPNILPLRDVKAGMKGIGRTVFAGDRIEEFQADILGVLENSGPGQSIILARLSGGPLAKTGVMQGMSGSPVYVDGKLIGAVALAFTFATDSIAGIRPIEEMFDVARDKATNRAGLPPPPRTEFAWNGGSKLVELATPVSFSGFSRMAVEKFGPELRKLGLEPMQGALGGGGGATSVVTGDPRKIQPGSMISVQLMTGDMAVGADGTVTHIDGDKVYAFGHRFLAGGPTAMPFARSEVLALLPNLTTSFKISSAREHMGMITQDRNAAISGVFGKRPQMVPMSISVRGPGGPKRDFKMEMVPDRIFAPLLTQMAIFSAIDGSERTLGPGTFTVRGSMEFEGGLPPVRLDNTFSTDMNAPALTAIYTSVPLTYLMQAGFEDLKVKSIQLDIEGTDGRKALQLDQAWSSGREVRAGEAVELNLSLVGDNGSELFRKVKYQLPVGIATGPLYFTISDGMTSNFAELTQVASAKSRTPSQVIQILNSLRANNKMAIKVWRPDPAYSIPGSELPAPPASVGLILARLQTAGSLPINAGRGAKIAEFEVDLGNAVGSGSKTIQVEVKE
jgi:hypothetical protein